MGIAGEKGKRRWALRTERVFRWGPGMRGAAGRECPRCEFLAPELERRGRCVGGTEKDSRGLWGKNFAGGVEEKGGAEPTTGRSETLFPLGALSQSEGTVS